MFTAAWDEPFALPSEESATLALRTQQLIALESGVPEASRKRLADIGWTLGAPDGGFGRYQCIERRVDGPTRVYAAASEMRADGCALAY